MIKIDNHGSTAFVEFEIEPNEWIIVGGGTMEIE